MRPGIALALAAVIGATLIACGSDKDGGGGGGGTATGTTTAAAPGTAVASPAVALCERVNAQMKACLEPIVAAVAAERQQAGFVGPALEQQVTTLRDRLSAPPSCAGATEAKLAPIAACASDDCGAMAPCLAKVLVGPRPRPGPAAAGTDAGPTVAARAGAFDGNVLFVMVDTVRADRLGVGGYRRDGTSLTPRLDAFAATATRFTRAYAQGANTPRSLPSIWTSRYPSQVAFHKVFHNFPAVEPQDELLFEVLAAGGLLTTGFSSHFYFEARRNVAQGFAEYDNEGALSLAGSNKDYAAPRIIPKAIARLEQLAQDKRRFAMFVHLFEPHSTYIKYDEYPVKLKGVAGLEEKYDYEIAVADRWIGELLDALDRTKLTDRTMVVILSDHGEAFGVHTFEGERLYFHGQTLYDEVLRVPLLVRLPGVAPAVVDDVVGLIDVSPTILDALGLPAPERFVGRSLLPRMRGEPLSPRGVGAEMQKTPGWKHEARAYVAAGGKDKIIVRGDGTTEVFDLEADPEERKNLSRSDPARTERLRAELEAWTASLTPPAAASPAAAPP